MQTNPTLAANPAVMQEEVSALRFHAERLRDASLIAGSATVAEPRIIAARQLAEHVLRTIDNLPALHACEEVVQ